MSGVASAVQDMLIYCSLDYDVSYWKWKITATDLLKTTA